VLGVGTIWSSLGLLQGATTNNPIFTGAQATAAYNQIFGTNATGVPVENTGGGGTRNSHWRESIFRTELMTGFLGPGVINPLSRVTVASMADMGYTVNMAAADAYTRPAGVVVSTTTSASSPSSLRSLVSSQSEVSTSGWRGWVETVSQRSDSSALRSSLLTRTQQQAVPLRLNERSVDAVMSESRRAMDEVDSTGVAQDDGSDEADFGAAWDELAESLHGWPALAIA
jgi:hypothetical protein